MLSVQPGLRGSNDLSVGRKMATFQLFFQSGIENENIRFIFLRVVDRAF